MLRVAIVTGGSRGIGREAARELASRGYAVAVGYAHDQAGADAAVDEILAAGGVAIAIRADVTDELDVERLFSETEAAFGWVDLVVHGAPEAVAFVEIEAARHLAPGGAVVDPRDPEPWT
jgi:3-oxoacyl-[acyl-carrier protein] reductase